MITIWLIVCLELNSWHQASENQSSRSPIPAKLHDNHRWAWHPNRDPTVWQQKWGDKVHFKGLALADFQLHICKYENCDFCKFKNNLNITDHIRSNMLWQLGDPWNALNAIQLVLILISFFRQLPWKLPTSSINGKAIQCGDILAMYT